MNHVYQLMAFCGEFDSRYELQLMVDTDLQRVKAAMNELRVVVEQADTMAEGWVGALAYERSVGNLYVQIEKVRVGVLSNKNVEVIVNEEWTSPEYLDRMEEMLSDAFIESLRKY